MNHAKAIGIKLIVIGVVLFSILGIFYNATLGNIFIITLLVTGIAYAIGDLYILPRYGNVFATIADFGLAFVSIWLLSSMFIEANGQIIAASLFASVFIAIGEAVFHIYMKNQVLHNDDKRNNTHVINRNFQTEAAEETAETDYIRLRGGKDKL
ncbi:YndM family protein [Aquibacillus sp. 3ASR75-11]|uniref:YndM family protein n=1 Tax=Terrihalobacillus insolitus TaxID=2950438 RepID=A0A9X3WSG4_9BACI|nr:YndM family protein [Terrihalobacillus insolitus]MDC3412321.1 YndM family protein [Terrihalobacillus insolitus]MDC3422986.1 YndM family protein [Terrihalobacillus insolitus]